MKSSLFSKMVYSPWGNNLGVNSSGNGTDLLIHGPRQSLEKQQNSSEQPEIFHFLMLCFF